MKIGILTFYKVLNYGAVLQAYALQRALQKLGHEAFLVNYQPEALTKPYKVIHFKMLRHPSYCLKLFRRIFLFKPFEQFERQFLKEGNPYLSLKELIENPPGVDAYIVGSDQVWRTFFSGGEDTFFLPFENNALKISYAASCGGDYAFLQDERKVQLVRNFNAISVREQALGAELEKYNIPSQTVLDPTLLDGDYAEFIRENKLGDYILVYNVVSNANFRSKLRYLKKLTGLPVINIGPNHICGADKNLLGVSPADWVNLLYHARYVYTNSFHGVAFSVNFKKNFLYVPNGHVGDGRVIGFLSDIGLQETVINKTEDIDRRVATKYPFVDNGYLTKMREMSNRFLMEALI